MKRLQYFALFILLVSVACGITPAAPTATPSPQPTATFTPPPTNTPTPSPSPTATTDVAATLVAKRTETAGGVLAELDELLGDSEIAYQEGKLLWQEKSPITVNLSGPDGKYSEIDDGLTAANFILKSDVTWSATGIIVCGIVFRSEANIAEGLQYQFLYMRLSGLPAWDIELHEFNRFKNSPSSVQYSSALNQDNNATNQVVLIAQNEEFTVYINQVRQGKFYDYSKQSMDGRFAVTGYQDSGKGSCKFENSWIWGLK